MNRPLHFFVALACAATLLAGCAKPANTTENKVTGPVTDVGNSGLKSTGPASVAEKGDPAAGKGVFGRNCSSCHGATGVEGGVGPSLKNEKSRKNSAQAIAWIKDPRPPMPKLYPSPLTDKDVSDVAAYVESL